MNQKQEKTIKLARYLVTSPKSRITNRVGQNLLDIITDLQNQVAVLQKALIESQDWNWITAQEHMVDNHLSQYPIAEMQSLYELALRKPEKTIFDIQSEIIYSAIRNCREQLPTTSNEYGFVDACYSYRLVEFIDSLEPKE